MTEKEKPARRIIIDISQSYEERLQNLAYKEGVPVETVILDALNKGLRMKEAIEGSASRVPHKYTDRDWTEERLDPPVSSDLDMREN